VNFWSRHRSRLKLDAYDVALLAGFAALSVWPVVLLSSKAGPDHIWTGTDGLFLGDQMQYLGWIQNAARHILVSDPFRTNPGPADYLHPGLVISGLLVRMGVSPANAYLAWKPIAVVALFLAARAYIARLPISRSQSRFALGLALFYASPVTFFAASLHWLPAQDRYFLPTVGTEMWPGVYLWGYPFTAISVAALAFCLLAYERDRELRVVRPWAPLLGLLCAWLQPWQGGTVLGVLVVSEAIMWFRNDRGRPALLVATTVATALPLFYYAALSHFDPTWALSGRQNLTVVPMLAVLAVLIPLGLPALLAYRLRPLNYLAVTVRTWPIVALGVYLLIAVSHVGTYPLHALQGLSIPFAGLAVIGVSGLHLRGSDAAKAAIGVAVVACIVLPSTWQNFAKVRSLGDRTVYGQQPYFITSGEQQALDYLKRDRLTGSVLAPVYLGQTVPAETGRQSWVGIFSWTPNYAQRVAFADALFSGMLSSTKAEALIRTSGARFLLADCQHRNARVAVPRADLVSIHHFGCATVFQLASATSNSLLTSPIADRMPSPAPGPDRRSRVWAS